MKYHHSVECGQLGILGIEKYVSIIQEQNYYVLKLIENIIWKLLKLNYTLSVFILRKKHHIDAQHPCTHNTYSIRRSLKMYKFRSTVAIKKRIALYGCFSFWLVLNDNFFRIVWIEKKNTKWHCINVTRGQQVWCQNSFSITVSSV